MNSTEIKEYLARDEKKLMRVRVLATYELKGGATFHRLRLIYECGARCGHPILDIPAVQYQESNLLFTPWDWQGWMPDHPDDILKVKWRLGATEIEALMINDLPVIPGWAMNTISMVYGHED